MDLVAVTWSNIPGGDAVLAWYGGVPSFHDAEVLRLHLNRSEPSVLELEVTYPTRSIVTLFLDHWIDVQINGFSKQNVLGEMTLRVAGDRDVEPWEYGVGLRPGEIEFELAPYFGAYGKIRANVSHVALRPVA